MKTISVQISDIEYDTFGLSKNLFLFSEFADLIEKQRAKQALRNCVAIAEQIRLSEMSMDDINAEIEAVRKCKK